MHGRFTRLVHDKLGLEPVAPVTARPLKTPEAIIAKLVRVKTRLATMQDIAGTRATVPSLALQDRIVAAALEEFAESGARLVKDSREDGDRYGYRAVHVVVTITGRLAEIQVRTTAQDAWAQIVEKLDEAMGTDLKHGRGRPEFHEWLHHLGDALRDADLGRPFEIPQAPFDQS